jgi:CDP-diacylglycerol--glycerol-3-phosphate 3-phosphatidyltransferase
MRQASTTEVSAPEAPRLLGVVPKKWILGVVSGAARLSRVLVGFDISPNTVSVFGLFAGLGAGVLFALGQPVWGAVLIIICGLFDIIDGQVAARANKKSLYGAIFDSTLDRYSEFFIYLGLAVYYRNRWPMWILFFTFLGSTMVSYTRARAEGLGIQCRVGVMQRAERMVLLVLGALLGFLFKVFDQAMIAVLLVIAVLSNITAFQRTLYVRKIEKHLKMEKEV